MKKTAVKKKSLQINREMYPEVKSILFWLIMSFAVLFLFIGPFHRGLFNGGHTSFEGEIYAAVLFSMFALLCLAIYFLKYWKLGDIRDILSLAIWLIPLSYIISYFNAASPHAAVNSIYIHLMYAVFFLIGLYFTRSKLGTGVITHAFVLSGYVLVFYGWLNWFGQAHYENAVLGSRLAGVFQYPNTYAAYLIAIYFSAIIFILTSKRWYVGVMHSFMLVPIFASFLLTLSRGAFIILPIILIIFLLLLPWKQQIISLVYLVISAAASVLIMQKMTGIRPGVTEQFEWTTAMSGWLILVVTASASAILTAGTRYVLEARLFHGKSKAQPFIFKQAVVPTIFLIIGIFGTLIILDGEIKEFLPETLQKRVESISVNTSSVLSRTTFYHDSFKLFKDYPWIGAGGGAWGALYESYKSYPYISKQAHNFLLQYLNEVGILGFSLFVLIGLTVFFLFFKQWIISEKNLIKLVYIIFPLTIFTHSLLDFDMTFVYIGAIFFLFLGAAGAYHPGFEVKNIFNNTRMSYLKKFITSTLILVSILTSFMTQKALKADQLYSVAIDKLNGRANFHEIMRPLNEAIKIRSTHPDYLLLKIHLLNQAYSFTKEENHYNQAIELITKLHLREPYNRMLVEEEYALLLSKGDFTRSIDLLSEHINKFPWDINLYERKISLLFDLGNRARLSDQQELLDQYWKSAIDIYEKVLDREKKLNEAPNVPKNSLREFRVTPEIALLIGQIYYYQEDYNAALKVFRLGRVSNKFNNTTNRLIARWYSATLIKLNKNDRRTYDLLIQYDPNEKEYINELLSINKK